MRFEQAYYTRGFGLLNIAKGEEGFGIAAASSQDSGFLEGCLSVGSKFDTEYGERKGTAKFVIYSQAFDSFVGVGVSPAPGTDRVGGNKLCHLFVPVQEAGEGHRIQKPEEYYLDYPFDDKMGSFRRLEQVELDPAFQDVKYQQILEKYEFDEIKLADFLWKLYEVLLQNNNLLLILLKEGDERKHEETAREITWLASCLVPGTGKRAVQYWKRLSYGVNTYQNVSKVNIVYSTDQTIHDNFFELYSTRGEKPPEFYCRLAKKALQPGKGFQEFIRQIEEINEELGNERISYDEICKLYTLWLLDYDHKTIEYNNSFLTIEDMTALVSRNPDNSKNRERFKKYILRIDSLKEQEIEQAWKFVDESEKKGIINTNEAADIIGRLISLSYGERLNKKYIRHIKNIPEHMRQNVLYKLFGDDNSCIKRHLELIKNVWDLIEAGKFYHGLGNVGYLDYLHLLVEEILQKDKLEEKKSFLAEYIYNLSNDLPKEEEIKKNLVDRNKGDFSGMIFCSWLFGIQKYSIWECIKLTNEDIIDQFDKICEELSKTKAYEKIENTKLDGNEWAEEELNRKCYLLYKQVADAKTCNINALDNCDIDPYWPGVENFLNRLEQDKVLMNGIQDYQRYGILYLKLQVIKKEKVPKDGRYKKQQCKKEYENNRKQYLQFFGQLVNIDVKGEDDKVITCLEEIKEFERLIQEEEDKNQFDRFKAAAEKDKAGYFCGVLKQIEKLNKMAKVYDDNLELMMDACKEYSILADPSEVLEGHCKKLESTLNIFKRAKEVKKPDASACRMEDAEGEMKQKTGISVHGADRCIQGQDISIVQVSGEETENNPQVYAGHSKVSKQNIDTCYKTVDEQPAYADHRTEDEQHTYADRKERTAQNANAAGSRDGQYAADHSSREKGQTAGAAAGQKEMFTKNDGTKTGVVSDQKDVPKKDSIVRYKPESETKGTGKAWPKQDQQDQQDQQDSQKKYAGVDETDLLSRKKKELTREIVSSLPYETWQINDDASSFTTKAGENEENQNFVLKKKDQTYQEYFKGQYKE